MKQKYPNREGFDSLALLNDKGSALDPFKYIISFYRLIVCSFYQIQNLHAVAIHELIVLAPKIIVPQRKLITMILLLILDFLFELLVFGKFYILIVGQGFTPAEKRNEYP